MLFWRFLFALAAGALLAVPALPQRASQSLVSSPQVVFVCEHGAAKSIMAAAHFNQLAEKRRLPHRAVARGTHPDPAFSSKAVAGLNVKGNRKIPRLWRLKFPHGWQWRFPAWSGSLPWLRGGRQRRGGGLGQQAGFALLFEPVAVALAVDRVRVVQQPVQDRRGQRIVVEDLAPLAIAFV